MLDAFFLPEAPKEHVYARLPPSESYPTTARLSFFDQARKVVHHAEQIALKVTQRLWDRLHPTVLWQKSHAPSPTTLIVELRLAQNRSV